MAKRLFLYVIFISVFFMPVLVQADINDELLKLKKQIPLIEMKVDKDIGPIIQKNVVLDDEISVLGEGSPQSRP